LTAPQQSFEISEIFVSLRECLRGFVVFVSSSLLKNPIESLSEREILALAISLEEEDERVLRADETSHRRRLLSL